MSASARSGGWLPHVVLGVVLVAQVAVARARHRSIAELEEARASGDALEHLDALHVLANRPTDGSEDGAEDRRTEFGIQLAKELYRADDARLREYAFATDICKFEVPLWQERMVEQRIPALEDLTAHWWRCYVIFKRKVGGQIVGGSLRLRMNELRWYFDALRGVDPDRDTTLEHLIALQHELQSRKGQ